MEKHVDENRNKLKKYIYCREYSNFLSNKSANKQIFAMAALRWSKVVFVLYEKQWPFLFYTVQKPAYMFVNVYDF